ncbi:hypothetical protein HPB48_010338 [Haemaphysalis longicornis]|uniref:Peptidase M13 N-terminal domain-containing protein n=1 Tax=Haemaphysalis longicornis TaxID=44386 RepID=A0A9J6H771_HAELO|nr:hypothetical protein HPB48_010338 [Haemaphysalis longicornis]
MLLEPHAALQREILLDPPEQPLLVAEKATNTSRDIGLLANNDFASLSRSTRQLFPRSSVILRNTDEVGCEGGYEKKRVEGPPHDTDTSIGDEEAPKKVKSTRRPSETAKKELVFSVSPSKPFRQALLVAPEKRPASIPALTKHKFKALHHSAEAQLVASLFETSPRMQTLCSDDPLSASMPCSMNDPRWLEILERRFPGNRPASGGSERSGRSYSGFCGGCHDKQLSSLDSHSCAEVHAEARRYRSVLNAAQPCYVSARRLPSSPESTAADAVAALSDVSKGTNTFRAAHKGRGTGPAQREAVYATTMNIGEEKDFHLRPLSALMTPVTQHATPSPVNFKELSRIFSIKRSPSTFSVSPSLQANNEVTSHLAALCGPVDTTLPGASHPTTAARAEGRTAARKVLSTDPSEDCKETLTQYKRQLEGNKNRRSAQKPVENSDRAATSRSSLARRPSKRRHTSSLPADATRKLKNEAKKSRSAFVMQGEPGTIKNSRRYNSLPTIDGNQPHARPASEARQGSVELTADLPGAQSNILLGEKPAIATSSSLLRSEPEARQKIYAEFSQDEASRINPASRSQEQELQKESRGDRHVADASIPKPLPRSVTAPCSEKGPRKRHVSCEWFSMLREILNPKHEQIPKIRHAASETKKAHVELPNLHRPQQTGDNGSVTVTASEGSTKGTEGNRATARQADASGSDAEGKTAASKGDLPETSSEDDDDDEVPALPQEQAQFGGLKTSKSAVTENSAHGGGDDRRNIAEMKSENGDTATINSPRPPEDQTHDLLATNQGSGNEIKKMDSFSLAPLERAGRILGELRMFLLHHNASNITLKHWRSIYPEVFIAAITSLLTVLWVTAVYPVHHHQPAHVWKPQPNGTTPIPSAKPQRDESGNFTATFTSSPAKAPRHYLCSTRYCSREAAYIKASIREDLSPCDNFYQFACRNWEASAALSPRGLGVSHSVDVALEKSVASALRDHILYQESDEAVTARDIFAACMAPNRRAAVFMRAHVFPMLPLNTWPTTVPDAPIQVWRTAGILVRRFGIAALLKVTVAVHKKGQEPTVQLEMPRQLFFVGDETRPKVTRMFADAIAEAASEFGEKRSSNLSRQIMSVFKSISELRDYTAFPACRKMSLKHLDYNIWTFVKTIFGTEVHPNTTVLVREADLVMGRLVRLTHNSNVQHFLNYLGFRLIVRLAVLFPENLLNLRRLFSVESSGRIFPDDLKWLLCMRFLESVAPFCLAKAQERTLAAAGGRGRARRLWLTLTQDFFSRSLRRLAWMSHRTLSVMEDKMKRYRYIHFFNGQSSSNITCKRAPRSGPQERLDEFKALRNILSLLQVHQRLQFTQIRRQKTVPDPGFLLETYPRLSEGQQTVYVPAALVNASVPENSTMLAFQLSRVATRLYGALVQIAGAGWSERGQCELDQWAPTQQSRRSVARVRQCLTNDLRSLPQRLQSRASDVLSGYDRGGRPAGVAILTQTAALELALAAFKSMFGF